MKFSYYNGSTMLDKYQGEYKDFRKALCNTDHNFDDMWNELDKLAKK